MQAYSVDGDIIAAVVLVVVKVILGVIVLGKLVVIVVVRRVVVVPGLEIRAVGVVVVIRSVLIQKIFQSDICFVVVGCGIIGGVMNRIESFVVAVDDLGVGCIAASIIVGDIATFILDAARGGGVIILGLGKSIAIITRRRNILILFCTRNPSIKITKKPILFQNFQAVMSTRRINNRRQRERNQNNQA